MPKVAKQVARPVVKKKVKGSSVLDRIRPVSVQNRAIKMTIYGRSGTGKTRLACTFPKKLLIIGAEDGTKSVSKTPDVDFVPLQSSEEIRELIDYVDGAGYKTVVLDTASSLQDMVMAEVLGIEELPAQKSWGMATQQDWGTCALRMKEILRALFGLTEKQEINVVVIAQEREFNNEGGSDVLLPYVGPGLTPSVTGWLNPASDYIAHTFIREGFTYKEVKVKGKVVRTKQPGGPPEFCLRVGPDAVFTTKFRIPEGELPKELVNPNYSQIAKLIGV